MQQIRGTGAADVLGEWELDGEVDGADAGLVKSRGRLRGWRRL